MKKLIVVLTAMVGLAMLSGKSEAAAGVRGAKAVVATTYSTTPTIVSKQPAALYSILIGTGAVTDYVVLFDSANATAASAVALGSTFKGKFHASSATANTQITFDPPLQFMNGITAVSATSVMTSQITYEPGKVVQGY